MKKVTLKDLMLKYGMQSLNVENDRKIYFIHEDCLVDLERDLEEDKPLAKESISHELDVCEKCYKELNPRVQEPKSKYTPEFEEWWGHWVDMKRNIAKPKCFEKWRKVLMASYYPFRPIDLINDIENQKSFYIESGFIPLPMTYLNQGRWEDTKEAILFNKKSNGFKQRDLVDEALSE